MFKKLNESIKGLKSLIGVPADETATVLFCVSVSSGDEDYRTDEDEVPFPYTPSKSKDWESLLIELSGNKDFVEWEFAAYLPNKNFKLPAPVKYSAAKPIPLVDGKRIDDENFDDEEKFLDISVKFIVKKSIKSDKKC